jgi:acetolactate synthase I/II/III large subunit
MKVRVADYVASFLARRGLRDVFMVTGGGAMHLNDAFGREKGLKVTCCHHEQACAIAAEAYYRVSDRPAVVNVTTGPGGTNAITGVWGAFVDSIPMVVVSGQVKFETCVGSTDLPLRQLGDQEVDIARLVAPVTKYAVMVTDPTTIRFELEKALHVALTGRPGPVWIDVPMNVQGAQIDPETLRGFTPEATPTTDLAAVARDVLARLQRAERPVVMLGAGVRVARAVEETRALVDALGVPVTTAFNAHDLMWDEHPLYVGRPGMLGDRAGNFAVQNADVLLTIGCRLSIRQVSYDWKKFARHAYKIVVDVDEAELKKPTIAPDLPVRADALDFARALRAAVGAGPTRDHGAWVQWCVERKRRYPVVLPAYWETQGAINPYCFTEALFRQLGPDEIVACADGTACVVPFQAARLKKGQRLFHNSGSAPMGYDLPAAIGACIAADRRRVVCLAGDGSIMMNLQELQTIATHRLPIVVFLFNNLGYHSIRQTQNAYFADSPVGFDEKSGVGLPDFAKVAAAFGFSYARVSRHAEMDAAIGDALGRVAPHVLELDVDPDVPFAPKLASRKLPDGRMVSSPLEDMSPFLPREELAQNMLVPLLEE